ALVRDARKGGGRLEREITRCLGTLLAELEHEAAVVQVCVARDVEQAHAVRERWSGADAGFHLRCRLHTRLLAALATAGERPGQRGGDEQRERAAPCPTFRGRPRVSCARVPPWRRRGVPSPLCEC